MKVNKLAKIKGKSSKEMIQEIDDHRVTHHNHEVPEDILVNYEVEEKKISEAEPERAPTVDSAETVIVEIEPEELELPNGVTPQMVWHACTGVGSRHELWKYKKLGRKPEK